MRTRLAVGRVIVYTVGGGVDKTGGPFSENTSLEPGYCLQFRALESVTQTTTPEGSNIPAHHCCGLRQLLCTKKFAVIFLTVFDIPAFGVKYDQNKSDTRCQVWTGSGYNPASQRLKCLCI